MENLISKVLSNMTEEVYPEFKEFMLKLFENQKDLLRQNFLNSRHFKPLENQETFLLFLKFLNDIFDQNDSIIVECVRSENTVHRRLRRKVASELQQSSCISKHRINQMKYKRK
ncbi:hypothetical protein ACKWTF_015904 [Chironomus riparius]